MLIQKVNPASSICGYLHKYSSKVDLMRLLRASDLTGNRDHDWKVTLLVGTLAGLPDQAQPDVQ